MKGLSMVVLWGELVLGGNSSWAGASYESCLDKLFDEAVGARHFAENHEQNKAPEGEFGKEATSHLQRIEEAVKAVAPFWTLLPEGDKSKNLGNSVGKIIESLRDYLVDPEGQPEVEVRFKSLHHVVCALYGYAYESSKDQLLLISQQLKDSNKETVSKDKGTVEKLVEQKKSLFFWPKM